MRGETNVGNFGMYIYTVAGGCFHRPLFFTPLCSTCLFRPCVWQHLLPLRSCAVFFTSPFSFSFIPPPSIVCFIFRSLLSIYHNSPLPASSPTLLLVLFSSEVEQGYSIGGGCCRRLGVKLVWMLMNSVHQKDDRKILRHWKWSCVIMDEAHALKDKNSYRWKNLMSVARNARQRLMLTGMPLQNDLHELWSMLEFLMPDIFETGDVDLKKLLNAEDRDLIGRMRSILGPFIFKKVKIRCDAAACSNDAEDRVCVHGKTATRCL